MSEIRKQSMSSNESIKSIDSRSYSTDKSRSDSDKQRSNSDDASEILNIDVSTNLIFKEGWGINIKKEEKKNKHKRRSRDITYKPRKTPTPTINFDYLHAARVGANCSLIWTGLFFALQCINHLQI